MWTWTNFTGYVNVLDLKDGCERKKIDMKGCGLHIPGGLGGDRCPPSAPSYPSSPDSNSSKVRLDALLESVTEL